MSTCDVCGAPASSTLCLCPWSGQRYHNCQSCLERPALREGTFRDLYDSVKGEVAKLDQRIKNFYTWIDGKYVHWDNYVYRRKNAS